MKKHSLKKRLLLLPLLIPVLLVLAFLLYAGQYYPADGTALAALNPDDTVSVRKTEYGWLFDGPSDSDALIFYPGAKVEETAYAPLLHRLAAEGMDVCLVKMPFRLAFFGMNRADALLSGYGYSRWYIGGHSLGGAMAAVYAADHGARLSGLVLLAAYPTKPLDDHLRVISVFGSEDGVINREKLEEGDRFFPENTVRHRIEGGNHARFGNYGAQRGDGTAAISAEEQQRQTVELIRQHLLPAS